MIGNGVRVQVRRRVLALLTALLMLCSVLCGCGGAQRNTTSSKVQKLKNLNLHPDQYTGLTDTDLRCSPQPLLTKDNVIFHVTGMEYQPDNGVYLNVEVDNLSDHYIWVYTENAAINGKTCMATGGNSVAPGENGQARVVVFQSELAKYGFETIWEFAGVLKVEVEVREQSTAPDGSVSYSADQVSIESYEVPYTIGTNQEGKPTNLMDKGDIMVYNQDGLTAMLAGWSELPDGTDGLVLVLENNTKTPAYFSSILPVHVNGEDNTSPVYADILPGTQTLLIAPFQRPLNTFAGTFAFLDSSFQPYLTTDEVLVEMERDS